VSRVDWNDLTSLIEGEAIVLFGGRRIYARVFHAQIDDEGWKRLGRTVMLAAPNPRDLRARLDRADAMATMIERGALTVRENDEVSPGLAALIVGFSVAAEAGATGRQCAYAALLALSHVPEHQLPPRPPPPSDGSPVTAVSPMLVAASVGPVAGSGSAGHPNEPIDGVLVRRLIAVESAAGLDAAHARAAAMLALTERDEGLARGVEVDPPPMTAEAFVGHLRTVLTLLRALEGRQHPRKAA
jgi:intracellular multiplication protein IcmO